MIIAQFYKFSAITKGGENVDEQKEKQIIKEINEELDRNFVRRKKECELLEESYRRISESLEVNALNQFVDDETGEVLKNNYTNKSINVERCATILDFKQINGEKKLVDANFCRDRLCPMCNWRRGMRAFTQMSEVMEVIQNDYQFVFLTLTVTNCKGEELNKTIDDLLKSFKKLTNYKKFKKATKGYFRALEITHDVEPTITKKMYYKRRKHYDKNGYKIGDPNPAYDTYHPHFHIIMAMDKQYFTNGDYITQPEFVEMWRRATKNPNIVSVWISKIKDNETYKKEKGTIKKDDVLKKISTSSELNTISCSKAVTEVTKYSVKCDDFLIKEDEEMTDRTVKILSEALKGRRLMAWAGIFEEIRNQLGLEDIEDESADLVGADEEVNTEETPIYRYMWSPNKKKYILIEIIPPEFQELKKVNVSDTSSKNHPPPEGT